MLLGSNSNIYFAHCNKGKVPNEENKISCNIGSLRKAQVLLTQLENGVQVQPSQDKFSLEWVIGVIFTLLLGWAGALVIGKQEGKSYLVKVSWLKGTRKAELSIF